MDTPGPRTSLDAITPKVTQAWYIVACSDAVSPGGLMATRVHGKPIVVYRTASGQPRVVEDRCPHRSVPLSFGRVQGETLACGYHGWRFDGEGACVLVPALDGPSEHPARHAVAYPCIEQQGFIWAWTDPGVAPRGAPFHFRHADDTAYATVRKVLPARGSVHGVIENALDVPHTAFLHGGLFRNDGERKPIRCVIKRYHDRCECTFLGESRPDGIAGRILSPSGGDVSHVDRFYLPSITEVEYRIGPENHVVLNGAVTPLDDFETVLYAVVSVRSRIPGFLLKPLVQPLALKIFAQDAEILALQTQTLHTFGEARFVSTDIDVLGHHILKLMHKAARGDLDDPTTPPVERETTMWL